MNFTTALPCACCAPLGCVFGLVFHFMGSHLFRFVLARRNTENGRPSFFNWSHAFNPPNFELSLAILAKPVSRRVCFLGKQTAVTLSNCARRSFGDMSLFSRMESVVSRCPSHTVFFFGLDGARSPYFWFSVCLDQKFKNSKMNKINSP